MTKVYQNPLYGTRLPYFWLGAEAKRIADEYETQQQLAREAYTVDHTDAQTDE